MSVFEAVHILRLRRRADRFDADGKRREAYAAYCEVAEFWGPRSPLLGASNWSMAAQQAAALEDRAGQVAACRRALKLLSGRSRWTPLALAARTEALILAADGQFWQNRLHEAEATARQAIASAEVYGRRNMTIHAYARLGQALLRLGRPEETLGCQRRVLELSRATGDPVLISVALSDFANALHQVAQLGEAEQAATEALQVLDATAPTPQTEAARFGPLSILAIIWRATGDHAKGIETARQAMAMAEKRGSREQYLQARMAWALGLMERGDYGESRAALAEIHAEQLSRGAAHLAGRTAVSLASAYVQTGELDTAREWAERAVAELEGGDIDGRGAALFILSGVDALRGDLAGALATARRSVDDLEELRRGVTEDQLYISVLETQARMYHSLQSLLLMDGDPDGALMASERARGRGLLRRLTAPGSAPGPWGREPTVEWATSLAAAHSTGFLVYSFVPGFATQSTLDALSGAPIDDMAGLHVWYLDSRGVAHGAIDLEQLRAIRDAAAKPEPPDPFLGLVRDLSAPGLIAGDGFDEESVALTSRMLIDPVAAALEHTDARQIVIVPAGELDRIPYGALSLRSGLLLSDRWPLAVVPAIGVFAELAAHSGGDDAGGPPVRDVLLVGNPEPQSRPFSPGLPVPALPPLPHAEREVRALAEQYPVRPPLIGPAATRAAVLASLADCEIAHFATHGFYGSDEGGTPGALCLSPHGEDDGYLRADDVRALDLPRCRLAVLSACQTGWGRSTYEGSLGLARAFLAAGVPAVVVSLWPVHDDSTADLMIALHRHLRSGLSVGEALRRAMLQARSTGADLHDWSSFTIVGDPSVRLAAAPE